MENNSPNQTIGSDSRPMVQAPTPDVPKKQTNKLGLLIGGIVGAVALIGIIVAIILVATKPKANAFDMALQKLSSRDNSKNLELDGNIDITFPGSMAGISGFSLDINNKTPKSSDANDMVINANIRLTGGEILSLKIEEIVIGNRKVYIKFSGLADMFAKLTGYPYESLPKDNPVIQLIDKTDNQWLLMTQEYIEDSLGSQNMTSGIANVKPLICASSLFSDFGKNSNSLVELYKKHPFIGSTQQGISIASKKNPLYKIVLDETSFLAFFEDFGDTEPAKNFAQCMGVKSLALDAEDKEELGDFLKALPDVYLEIDENYDITRLYFEASPDFAEIEAKADFDFTSPAEINIAEPTEYKEFMEIQQDFQNNVSPILQTEN